MNVGNILTLIGGLGLFLYGMRVMSDSIEKDVYKRQLIM